MGGAMRQAGLLAAGGIYALQNLVDRLAEDHANARLLARAAERWPGITLNHSVDINIVYFDVEHTGLTAAQFCERLAGRGVLADPVDVNRVRFVTHREITAEDIRATVAAIDGVLAAAGTIT
jgi:threonine aldolase